MINTPAEVLTGVEQMAIKKYHTPLPRLITLGILAGIYIAMGGLLSVLISTGMPGLSEANPALPRLLAGMFFPVGLALIILVGGELFTGNTSYLMPAVVRKSIPAHYILTNWTIVYFTNFIGALFFSYFFIHLTGLFDAEPWHSAIIAMGEKKVSMSWGVTFLKGIGANWLVCLAVWLGMSSQEMLGRLIGLWIPVMAFVAMGFEHSIANMFYIPMAMMTGADITVGQMIMDNLIPATLGNIVGGACFVGMIYTYLYNNKPANK